MSKISVVVPNWNGAESLPKCLDSLLGQSLPGRIIVVDNGSKDGSLELLSSGYPQVEVVALPTNKGFAGGVNAGIRRAMQTETEFIALLNNDAAADKDWLKHLVSYLDSHSKVGITTSKILDSRGEYLDSTGDIYSIWGLPYPRGRREAATTKYDSERDVFGASGGASLYRVGMLQDIGLFDKNFFAYYEDVDLSFRAQLAGWKVAYVPKSLAYHHIGYTSGKLAGFTTYHTIKNLPMLMIKNVPLALLPRVLPRLALAHTMFVGRALSRGQFWPVIKGLVHGLILLPKKLFQRWQIQGRRKVSTSYINSMMTHDIPPNAHKLRKLRSAWWRATGKASS